MKHVENIDAEAWAALFRAEIVSAGRWALGQLSEDGWRYHVLYIDEGLGRVAIAAARNKVVQRLTRLPSLATIKYDPYEISIQLVGKRPTVPILQSCTVLAVTGVFRVPLSIMARAFRTVDFAQVHPDDAYLVYTDDVLDTYDGEVYTLDIGGGHALILRAGFDEAEGIITVNFSGG